MKKSFFLVTIFSLLISVVSAQVGIGTTKPSPASMLEVSSTSDDGVTYKGIMPPRVPTQTDRDKIHATSIDVGLLVFVEETGTLEIWNGINWESIYTLNTQTITLAAQDFDSNIDWSFTNVPAFYNVPDENDIWGTVSSLNSDADDNIDFVSGTFLGCRDLNNDNGGNPNNHKIQFVNIDISLVTNPRIAFDYDVYQFDGGDDVKYIVYYDDIAQPSVLLVEGMNGVDVTKEGTVIITIPSGISNVRLDVLITQNGDADYAGFDNFRVYGQ